MQDVERHQPHGKKVSIISSTAAAASPGTAGPGAQEAREPEENSLRRALKLSTSALKSAGVPFGLGGSYALWVHGAPEPEHDVDLMVAEEEVEAAVACLAEAGFEIVRPPEDWLFKAYREDALVDVLHRLSGAVIEPALIELAVETEVLGMRIPILPAQPIMVAKFRALSEHYSNFGAMLPVLRAVREQLDWAALARDTADNPFAEALLLLCDRLGLSR